MMERSLRVSTENGIDSRLRTIDRRLFEELIAHLFERFGYDVELTQKTRDGGRDIIAVRNRIVSVKYLVECKRPDPGHCIGIKPVRELYGVVKDERATKGVLVTTTHFSRDAVKFFERAYWEIEGRDFRGLMEWIEECNRLKGNREKPNKANSADAKSRAAD